MKYVKANTIQFIYHQLVKTFISHLQAVSLSKQKSLYSSAVSQCSYLSCTCYFLCNQRNIEVIYLILCLVWMRLAYFGKEFHSRHSLARKKTAPRFKAIKDHLTLLPFFIQKNLVLCCKPHSKTEPPLKMQAESMGALIHRVACFYKIKMRGYAKSIQTLQQLHLKLKNLCILIYVYTVC